MRALLPEWVGALIDTEFKQATRMQQNCKNWVCWRKLVTKGHTFERQTLSLAPFSPYLLCFLFAMKRAAQIYHGLPAMMFGFVSVTGEPASFGPKPQM